MDRKEIRDILESFFQKYRKSEGDDSTYTAFWADRTPAGTVEIAMTRCPADTTFKFYLDRKKVDEVKEWDGFFPALDRFAREHGDAFDPESFFAGMKDMT
ncbi:hypothetical protein [Desulfonatronovibrio hydrogenovorans]|uniref:hypothetical protein n=1 Tax=Desulfonatronovibrio hydrogenovorans TaxID=53245 RepID=UPI00048FF1CE|nr:hypothetical protein [Desulfonatronovibrio hydrogenovorans]